MILGVPIPKHFSVLLVCFDVTDVSFHVPVYKHFPFSMVRSNRSLAG